MRAGAGAAGEGASGGRGAGGSGRDGADGEGGHRGVGGGCEELPAGPAARGCVRLLHTCHRCAARGGAGWRPG